MVARLLFLAGLVVATAVGSCSVVNDLEWTSKNDTLPKVLVLSAGGTILSSSNWSRVDNIAYGSGVRPTVDDLIGNATEVLDIAQLAVIEFPASGGSAGLNSSLYLNISQHANKYLCGEGSDVAGAIMFHGTNTLEETAFGVDLTLGCDKPFVATGAMRPASYLSFDGLSNFLQAVSAAASPSSRGRGGLIAFNDRITSIYYSSKTNANTPDTFKAVEQGNLGTFLAGQPYYFFEPALPTGKPFFNITDTVELPSVQVLWAGQGFDTHLMRAAVDNGAKGLVFMGSGAASLSPDARDVAAQLYDEGIPTISVGRMGSGTGVPGVTPGKWFYGSYLGGEHARVMLQLALNAGYNMAEIQDLFEGPLRRAVYTSSNLEYYGF